MRLRNLRMLGGLALALLGGVWSAASLAGGDNPAGACTVTAWGKPCKHSKKHKKHKPPTFTTPGETIVTPPVTITAPTTPGETTTVTLPASTTATPPTTVTITTTTPAQTVTVTTPGKIVVKGKPTCAHGDWDVSAPRCKPKLIQACKGPYRKEILRWCLNYEKPKKKVKGRESSPPSVTKGGGVTGACDQRHPCRPW